MFLGISLAVAAPAAADERAERRAIVKVAEDAFRARDWATLDRLASEYRTGRDRTPSGIWKLTALYAGIEGFIPSYRERDEARFEQVESRLLEWAAASPRSATAQIAYAKALIGHGWFHRGAKAARYVPREAWEPFRRYVEQARAHLERHREAASVDPWWYETMIGIARAQGWERARFEALLDEALDREPLYYETYFEAFFYLLPQWHGSAAGIEDFANRAVARTQRQEGMSMYARIYWFAAQKEYGSEIFRKTAVRWPKLKGGFEDMLARYPDAWNLDHFAKFACLAGDRATARDLFARLPSAPVTSTWLSESLVEECRQWSSTR